MEIGGDSISYALDIVNEQEATTSCSRRINTYLLMMGYNLLFEQR